MKNFDMYKQTIEFKQYKKECERYLKRCIISEREFYHVTAESLDNMIYFYQDECISYMTFIIDLYYEFQPNSKIYVAREFVNLDL